MDYHPVSKKEERDQLHTAIQILESITGKRPLGWYTGRNSPNTRPLVMEEGGFLYDSDAYDDDLPYWLDNQGEGHLVIPYTLDTNDMRFSVIIVTSIFFNHIISKCIVRKHLVAQLPSLFVSLKLHVVAKVNA